MRRLVRKNHTGQFKTGSLVVMGDRVHTIEATSDRGHMFKPSCLNSMHWVGLAVTEVGGRMKCKECFRESING